MLVEDGDKFYLAYVSTHPRAGVAERTELILKDRVSLFQRKHWTLYRKMAIPFLVYWFIRVVTAPFSFFLITGEYGRVPQMHVLHLRQGLTKA